MSADEPPTRPPTPARPPTATTITRRPPAGVWGLVGFLAIGVGGLGAAAWMLGVAKQDAERELGGLRQASAACQRELAEARKVGHDLSEQVAARAQAHDRERAAREHADQAVLSLSANLDASQAELADLRRVRAENEKRLETFRDLTTRFQKMVDTGELKVKVRKGRMLVRLPAEVLFPSGSAKLSPRGRKAISKVAGVLAQLPDRQFLVAGHTDNVKVGASIYRSNWELSAARALAVTELLIEAGVSPKSLAVSGYGEHDPIRRNKTEAGRRENRRIEIILAPRIEELPRLPAELLAAEDEDEDGGAEGGAKPDLRAKGAGAGGTGAGTGAGGTGAGDTNVGDGASSPAGRSGPNPAKAGAAGAP